MKPFFLLLLLTVIASHEEASGLNLRLQDDPNTESDGGKLSAQLGTGIMKKGEPISTEQNTDRTIKEATAMQHIISAAQLPVKPTKRGHGHQFSIKSPLMKKREFSTKSPLMRRRYRRSFGYKTKCIPMKMKQCRVFNVNGLLKNYCVTYSAVVCTALD